MTAQQYYTVSYNKFIHIKVMREIKFQENKYKDINSLLNCIPFICIICSFLNI